MSPPNTFRQPSPPTNLTTLSHPFPHIFLITLSRPRKLNCIDTAGHHELHRLFEWYDNEPALRVCIVTGQGRAFCAGADLNEWNILAKDPATKFTAGPSMPPSGFGGLSRRRGKKPVIAAVNGLAYGGGCEMVVNCDLVVAAPSARFALPEARRGVAAMAGALPRLPRLIGRLRAMEMVLTGRDVHAAEALQWGLCNAVAKADGDGQGVRDGVVELAMEYGKMIAACSPDSIIVSKDGVQTSWDVADVEVASTRLQHGFWQRAQQGDNYREGLKAFVEKREPKWVSSKL